MSSLRKSEIAGIFSRWLERYSPPASIKDKPQAVQDETEALLAVLLKMAPQDGAAAFVARALDRLEYQMKTRAWPTKGELGAVCSNLRKDGPKGNANGDVDTRAVAVAARKMQASEPVGEGYLWGLCAVEMIAEGLIDEATMRRYRSGAFLSRKAQYGEAAALDWEAGAKARHEDAKAVWRVDFHPELSRLGA
jgi:hypothetical protein